MQSYFKMSDISKDAHMRKLYRQLLGVQQQMMDEEDEHIPIRIIYERALRGAERNEDYEMCQALRDSAKKYKIELDGQ
jgi:hypothetical protein